DRGEPLHRRRHLDLRLAMLVAQDPPIRPRRQGEQRMLHRRHVVLRHRRQYITKKEIRRRNNLIRLCPACGYGGAGSLPALPALDLPHETVCPFFVVSMTPTVSQPDHSGNGRISWFRNQWIVVSDSEDR